MLVFEITTQHHEIAQLLADGVLTDKEIAERYGISRTTLWHWKQRDDFSALVNECKARFAEEVQRRGLADRMRRINALNDRWVRMQRVIEARADAPEMADVPGGSTGLIVRNVKAVGMGKDFQLIDLYEVDTGLLNELRQHEKQAAQELGQWTEKREYGGDAGGPMVIRVVEAVKPHDAESATD